MKPSNVAWVALVCAACFGAGTVATQAQEPAAAAPVAVPVATNAVPALPATNNTVAVVAAAPATTNVPPQVVPAGDTPKAPAVTPLTGRVPRRRERTPEVPALESADESAYAKLIAERLWVGGRSVSSTLQDTERPADRDGGATFIGYVNKLEEVESRTTQFVVGYNLSRYLSVEYSEGEIAARTRNYNNDLSDGVVRMSGPVYTAVARYPLFDRIIPFIGISYAPWDGEFEHDAWWQLGWPSPENYAAAGSPYRTTGMSRTIEVEGDTCRTLTYGVAVKLHRHVEIEFLMRELELETEARFYHTIDGTRTLERTGSFPLDHKSYGIALKAIF